ncbi:hypothetical protein BZG01_00150 [Labilibaculum manganireducens]|uniref:DUF935 family protein n=1 Tax=Labilibaculum manganireducens TaxID=1940525 RepID=A0A2N3IGC7_9BACT|nr:DUF935 family protein [Labilibaculum manganireducens]PKQ69384.1 hypothetical protein BZG01_00150 [Labilibaculum manganireducens]
MGILDRFLNKSSDSKQTTTVKKGKRMSAEVNKPQPDRVVMQMSTLRQALEEAEDKSNPSWEKLHLIYKNAVKDAQVITQNATAVNELQASHFVVEVDGIENEELTDLFKKPWFADFIKIYYDAELWGYTVCEFGQQDVNGEFLGCKVFPRTNIYPFNRNIIIESTDTSGIPIGDKPEALFLFEIGETDDLGLLESISREVIFKAFARGDWAEHSEKWGMPRVIYKTDTDDETELDKKERAAANFARNGYMIADIDDEIETLEDSSAGSGHLIYKDNVELCNKEIAKLINGQTGTSDEQAYVGSAEVHERILDQYTASRLRRLTNLINFRLHNFLRYHGYQIHDNAKIRFPELDPKTAKENSQAIVNDPDEEDAKKKSPVNRLPWSE